MEDEADTQPPAARARYWVRAGLLLLLLLVAAGTVAWTQRLSLAEFIAQHAASAFGVGDVELTVAKLELDGASVTDISVGGDKGQRIARIDATYRLGQLWHGTIDSLSVRGLLLRGSVGADGVVFPGLPKPEPAETSAPQGLPIRFLRLDDSRIELETPQGAVMLSANGTIETPDGNTSDVSIAFSLRSAFGSLQGTTTATRLESGDFYGHVVLREGKAAGASVMASGIDGEIQFVSLADGALDVDANLTAAAFSVSGESLGETQFSVGGRTPAANNYALEANLHNDAGRADVTGRIARTDDGKIDADIRYAFDAAHGDLRGEATGSATLSVTPNKAIKGAFRLHKGSLNDATNALSGITGTGTVNLSPAGMPQGAINIAYERFEAFGLTGKPGRLTARLDENRMALETALNWSGGSLKFKADGAADGPLTFESEGQLTSLSSLSQQLDRITAQGEAAYAISGKLAYPGGVLGIAEAEPAALFHHLTARGWLDAALHDVAIAGAVRGGSLNGRADLSKNAEGIQIATRQLRLAVQGLEKALRETFPEPLRRRVDAPFEIAIRPHGRDTALVTIAPYDSGHLAVADTAIHLNAADADIVFRGKVDAAIDRSGRLHNLSTPRATVDVKARDAAFGKLTSQLTLTGFQFAENALETAFGLTATYDGTVHASLAPLHAVSRLAGRVTLLEDTLTAAITRDGRLSVDRIKIDETIESTAPLVAALSAPLQARINLREGVSSLGYRAALTLSDTVLKTKAGDEWHEISLSGLPITATAKGGRHTIGVQAKSIEVPQHDLSLSGLAVDLVVAATRQATITIDSINHRAKPAFVLPLRFTGAVSEIDQRFEFDGRLFDPGEQFSVALVGHHDMAVGNGLLAIDAAKLVFLPTVLQPVQLFPILGDTLREVDGNVDAHAEIAWEGEEIDSSLELRVDARLIKSDEFSFENAATVVTFDSLFPPSTAAKQEVNIGLLDVGVPMLNGRLEFQLEKDGSVRAALRELDFFGGRVETEEFVMPANFDGFTVPLAVNGVGLENLLALAQSGDLSATGTLNGQIPITIEKGEVAIRDGVLESAPGGGTIRYKPTAVGPSLSGANEGMKLFLQVVEDFQYDKVRVTLGEDAEGEVSFAFKIEGRNESVYKGIPVELNISMDGPLRKILTQGLKVYSLPERILSGAKQSKDKP